MPTSIRSTGYKKKPSTEPAKKGVSKTPSIHERREHQGKTPETKVDIAEAGRYEKAIHTVPSEAKRKLHAGKAKGKAKRQERKQLREAGNINVYNGAEKPAQGNSKRAQHQRALAKRGRAVRKILAIQKEKGKATQTPYRNLKHTQVLRVAREEQLEDIRHNSLKILSNPNIDPKTKKRSKAIAALSHGELQRLGGRGVEATHMGKQASSGLSKHHDLDAPQAAQMFKRGENLARRGAVLSSEAQLTPRSALEPKKIDGKDHYFVASKNLPKETTFNQKIVTHKGKKGLWLTPSQIGEVKKIRTKYKQWGQKSEPEPSLAEAVTFAVPEISAVDTVGFKAAKELGLLGAENAAKGIAKGTISSDRYIYGAAKADELAKAVGKAKGTLGEAAGKLPVVKQVKGFSEARVAQNAAKIEKIKGNAEPYLKDVGLRKEPVRNEKGQFQGSKWVPGKSINELNEDLVSKGAPDKERQVIIKAASDKVEQQAEHFAKDSSVIAGAGSPQDVTESMLKEAVDLVTNTARITDGKVFGRTVSANTKAHLIRTGTKVGIPGVPLVAGSIANSDFRENALRDAEDLIAGFVPSTVEFLRASSEATAYGFTSLIPGLEKPVGSPTRFEAMWDGFKKTSPVALAIEGEWDKAAKAFEERPVSSLLEVSGVYDAAGKGLGSFGRKLPEGLKFGQLDGRSDLHYWGDIKKKRAYSPNVFAKLVQKQLDKSGDMMFGNVRLPAEYRRGQPIWKNKIQELSAKNAGAEQLLAVNHSIDSQYALSKIRSRASHSNIVREMNDVFDRVKKDKNLSREDKKGSNHAISYGATRVMRGPKTAVEDMKEFKTELDQKISNYQKKNKGNKRRLETDDLLQMKANREIVESLLDRPDLLTSESTWDGVRKFTENEEKRQQHLVEIGALDPKQKELAKYFPYVEKWMVKRGSIRFDASEGIYKIKEDGKYRPLTEKDIHEHMVNVSGMDPKLDSPAMVSFRQKDAGNYPFHEKFAVGDLSASSTNTLFRDGTYHLDGSSLTDQALLSQHIIDNRKMFVSLLDRMALRAPDTNFVIVHDNPDKLKDFYDSEFSGHGLDAKVMDITPLVENVKNSSDFDHRIVELSKKVKHGGEGKKYILVPKRAFDRLDEHVAWEKKFGNLVRNLNSEFKGSVLAFSLKWHIGNVVDMASRMFFEGAGARSYVMGRKLLNQVKEMDRKLTGDESYPTYHDLMATIMGGHYAATMDQMSKAFERADVDYLDAVSGQRRLSGDMAKLGKSGVENLLKPYRGVQHFSFAFGSKVEQELKTASFGKEAIKEANTMGEKMHKTMLMSPTVMEHLAKGLMDDSNVVEKYAKGVNDVMGDYTNMSPKFRAAVSTVTPFGLWARAATKFVLLLPANSPIRTAMITSVNRLNEKEREKLGLSRLKPTEIPGVYPYQRGAIPATEFGGGVGNIIRTNTYTSFGVLNDLESYANFIAPWEMGLYEMIGSGKNWYGDEVLKKDGRPLTFGERIGVGMGTILQTFFSPLKMAREIASHGTPSETWNPLNPTNEFSERVHRKKSDYSKVEEVEPSKTGAFGVFSPFSEEQSGTVKLKEKEKEKESEKSKSKSPSGNGWLFESNTQPKKSSKKKAAKKGENSWLFE